MTFIWWGETGPNRICFLTLAPAPYHKDHQSSNPIPLEDRIRRRAKFRDRPGDRLVVCVTQDAEEIALIKATPEFKGGLIREES